MRLWPLISKSSHGLCRLCCVASARNLKSFNALGMICGARGFVPLRARRSLKSGLVEFLGKYDLSSFLSFEISLLGGRWLLREAIHSNYGSLAFFGLSAKDEHNALKNQPMSIYAMATRPAY